MRIGGAKFTEERLEARTEHPSRVWLFPLVALDPQPRFCCLFFPSRFLGIKAVSLEPLFDPPGGDKAVEFAMATEGALMLLIWGEVRAGRGFFEEQKYLLQATVNCTGFVGCGCWSLSCAMGGVNGGNRVFGSLLRRASAH